MSAEIWVAIIAAVGSIVGVIITVAYGNKKNAKNNEETSKVTLYRLGELESKVDKHNHLVERMYNLEEKQSLSEQKIKSAERRIKDLEGFHTHR